MRRLALIGVVCAAGVALLVSGPLASSGEAGNSVRVDALFHNAAGLVAGEDVKIAGVPAGIVKSVDLTDSRLALVEMEVDSPFAPFRADARCQVRSQSLIGERFIQCDPGTIDAGTLAAGSDGTPTVPVNQDTAPIDLDLLFDVFRAPYRERLAIILNELGAGLTGRGEDLNAIIRSANPSLAQARRVLNDLNAQRADLTQGIDQTNRVLATVANDPQSVGRFVERLAGVSQRFGGHSDALGQSVARLPGLLAQAEPALRQLDGLSVDALPVLHNLRRSSPGVRELSAQLGPLSRAARPTLRRIGQTAVIGKTALERSLPFMSSLRGTLQGAAPLIPTTRDLTSSLVERGGTEGLIRFFYNAALATSRYDGVSHIFPAHLVGGVCGLYKTDEPPVQGCHGRFDYLPDSASSIKAAGLKGKAGAPAAPGSPPGTAAPTPGTGKRKGNGKGPLNLPALPSLPNLTPTPPSGSGSGSAPPNGIDSLLKFLLGQ